MSAPVVETAAPVVVRGKQTPKDWHNTSYYVKLKGEWLLARVDSEKGLPFKVNMHGLGEEGDKKFHFMYTLALFLKDVASLEKERSLVWMEDDYPSDLVEALNTAASIGKPEVAVAGRTACTEARHAFQSLGEWAVCTHCGHAQPLAEAGPTGDRHEHHYQLVVGEKKRKFAVCTHGCGMVRELKRKRLIL